MLDTLFSKARWLKKRDGYIQAARECREVLTDPHSYWHQRPDDERTKQAVGNWVEAARRAHAIGMGRRPVIPQALVINAQAARVGALYAE